MRKVERGRWLVEQEVPCAAVGERGPNLRQGAGEVDAVEFAAREGAAIAERQVRHVGGGHGAVDRGAMVLRVCAAAVRVAAEFDDVANAEREGERRALRQDSAL